MKRRSSRRVGGIHLQRQRITGHLAVGYGIGVFDEKGRRYVGGAVRRPHDQLGPADQAPRVECIQVFDFQLVRGGARQAVTHRLAVAGRIGQPPAIGLEPFGADPDRCIAQFIVAAAGRIQRAGDAPAARAPEPVRGDLAPVVARHVVATVTAEPRGGGGIGADPGHVRPIQPRTIGARGGMRWPEQRVVRQRRAQRIVMLMAHRVPQAIDRTAHQRVCRRRGADRVQVAAAQFEHPRMFADGDAEAVSEQIEKGEAVIDRTHQAVERAAGVGIAHADVLQNLAMRIAGGDRAFAR